MDMDLDAAESGAESDAAAPPKRQRALAGPIGSGQVASSAHKLPHAAPMAHDLGPGPSSSRELPRTSLLAPSLSAGPAIAALYSSNRASTAGCLEEAFTSRPVQLARRPAPLAYSNQDRQPQPQPATLSSAGLSSQAGPSGQLAAAEAAGASNEVLPTAVADAGNGGQPSSSSHGSCELADALRVQLQLQKKLHAQLEVQRQLQLSLESHSQYITSLLQAERQAVASAGDAGGSNNVAGGSSGATAAAAAATFAVAATAVALPIPPWPAGVVVDGSVATTGGGTVAGAGADPTAALPRFSDGTGFAPWLLGLETGEDVGLRMHEDRLSSLPPPSPL